MAPGRESESPSRILPRPATRSKACPVHIPSYLVAENTAAPDPGVSSFPETVTVVAVARPIISVFNPEVLGENKVKLEWKLDGGKAEQLRLIYYPGDRADTTEELGDRVDAIVEKDVTGETSYTFSDLPSGLGTFMLIAVNDAAPDTEGPDLAVSSSRTITVESVARPIIYDFQAESIGDKKVKLTWTLGGGEATKLKVRYSDGSGGSLDADGTNKSADVTHKMSKRSHTLDRLQAGSPHLRAARRERRRAPGKSQEVLL